MLYIGVHKAGGEFPCHPKMGPLVDIDSVYTLLGENVQVSLAEVSRRLTTCKFSDKIIHKEGCLS